MAPLILVSGCAFLHKSPPYKDPDRLVSVVKVAPAGEQLISGTDFLVLRSETQTLEPIAAYIFGGFDLPNESTPARIASAQVSADFFRALGVQPALGRAFVTEECQLGRNRVVVISHDLWQYRFG